MTNWTYFAKETLAPHQRRLKPIGRELVSGSELDQLLAVLVRSKWSADVLLTIATNSLEWLTDGRTTVMSWRGLRLSNGGAYIVPDREEAIRLHRHDRYFDRVLTPDGAGLCTTFLLIENIQNRENLFHKDRSRIWKRLYRHLNHHLEAP